MSENKPIVLVVDDTPANIDILREILKDEYKLKVAINGQKALKIAMSESPPDLILLDIMMPEMDGYEVCGKLKENETTKNIPVIFVTGKTEPEEIEKGKQLGAVDYIIKPIEPDIVLEKVKNHLCS